MSRIVDTRELSHDELIDQLSTLELKPLWKEAARLNTPAPTPRTVPWLWRWQSIAPLAARSGELVTIDRGGDRRVLALANPGLGGLPFTTSTLWGAIQYLNPGESAPAHRHSAAAIRFVMSGSGVFTTVDGDACDMRAGDLIVTPGWSWHDHTNAGDTAMTWFDGLDLPLVVGLDAVFFEPYPHTTQAVASTNRSEIVSGGHGLVPSQAGAPTAPRRRNRYPWGETDVVLTRLAEESGDAMVSVTFTNPFTGAPVLPTLGCEAHRLQPNRRTPTTRRAGSSVFVVFRGSGVSVIDGKTFDWNEGDIFCVPSWAALDHEAHVPTDLFALTDRPVLTALGLERDLDLPTHQKILGSFAHGE